MIPGPFICLSIFAIDSILFNVNLPYWARGVLDEPAHALTMALVLVALPRRPSRDFVISALICSVILDADHLPILFHTGWLEPATGRPDTHSLVVVVLVAVAGAAFRVDRPVIAGIVTGLLVHLGRDLATGTVPLLWPAVSEQFHVPYLAYALTLICLAAFAAGRPPIPVFLRFHGRPGS